MRIDEDVIQVSESVAAVDDESPYVSPDGLSLEKAERCTNIGD
jgi:hypothetical protein